MQPTRNRSLQACVLTCALSTLMSVTLLACADSGATIVGAVGSLGSDSDKTSTPPATAPAPVTPSATAMLDDEENAFVTLINNYRVANGLPTLAVSITLTEASDWMSVDMANKNYMEHTDSLSRDPFVRMADFGYPMSGSSGENIAAGNSTASATFLQWKNSSGHNANMLGAKYRAIGVARAYNANSTYRWYWTTDFGYVVDRAAP